MIRKTTKHFLAAFFMVGGSVCAGPAIAADEAEEVEAVDLFDPEAQGSEVPKVEVDAGGVTINAKDVDITTVLRILSMQSKRNIIASRNVSGTVSANLYKVDFYEALDAILQPNGFGYQEKGNFIYVKTLDEIKAEEDANRRKVHKLVRLNYISAADAAAYVSPLLSGDGSIAASAEVVAGFQPSLGDGGANSSAHADTLIIVDFEENVDEILGLLEQLDVKPDQVLIETTILQVRLTEENALGIDFAVYSDISIDDITTPLGVVDDLINKTGAGGTPLSSGNAIATSAGGTASGESGVQIGFLGSDASLFIRALDTVNDTNVLASPKALVLNRQMVDLLVGERLGYLSTTVTDTSEVSTVEFLDVGVQFTARPFISTDERIRMELRAALSDGNTDRVVDGNVIPEETAQEIVTNVIMKNAQTIVLGGLFKEDTGTARNQLPGIGHVPGIGLLGKGQDDTVQRSEVIFLIKPTIMKDEALSKMGGELERDAYQSVAGARDNLLPWSRTKMTAAHMTKARQFAEQGNDKKAMWHTNLALHLDPTMLEAMQLKQKLTGKAIYYQNFSALDKVVDSVIDAETGTAPEPPVSDEIPAEGGDKPAEPGTDTGAAIEGHEDADPALSQADESAADQTAEPVDTDAELNAIAAGLGDEPPAHDAADPQAEAGSEPEVADAANDAPMDDARTPADHDHGYEVVDVDIFFDEPTRDAGPATEAESVTAVEPAEYAQPAEPVTADAFEPVIFDDDEDPMTEEAWDDVDVEQVTEVDVDAVEAK